MYAIIATGGKQYRVQAGDVVNIEKIDAEIGSAVIFDDVLAVGGEKLLFGEDVKDAAVVGTVVDQFRDKKVIVYKYKPKTGFHKKKGHRQHHTKIWIEAVCQNAAEAETAKADAEAKYKERAAAAEARKAEKAAEAESED